MRVIAYYTTGTPYADEVDAFAESCREYLPPSWPVSIVPINSRGTWRKNTAAKPEILLQTIEACRGDDRFLYLDIDARVRRPIGPFFDGQPDAGKHYVAPIRADMATGFRGDELLSGTIYFERNARTLAVMERWRQLCHDEYKTWDQRHLAQAVAEADSLRFARLPVELCFIFDISRRENPGIEPAIEHLQASRRYKKLIL